MLFNGHKLNFPDFSKFGFAVDEVNNPSANASNGWNCEFPGAYGLFEWFGPERLGAGDCSLCILYLQTDCADRSAMRQV